MIALRYITEMALSFLLRRPSAPGEQFPSKRLERLFKGNRQVTIRFSPSCRRVPVGSKTAVKK